MQIINGTGLSMQAGQVGVSQAADSVTKMLQKQIQDLKKQLKDLSADQTINAEEKVRRQQDLQQQITDLQNQLRQHQMDQRREKLQEKTEEAKTSEQAGMEAVISADSAVKNAQVQEDVASRAEGRAKVLKSEIEMDGGRGRGTIIGSKLKELSKAEQASKDAKATQMQLLGDADQDLKGTDEAAKDPEHQVEEAQEKKEEQEAEARRKEEEKSETIMYTGDGKAVSEERESRISVRA